GNHFVAVGGLTATAPTSATGMLQRYAVAPGDLWEPSAVPTKLNNPNAGLPLSPFSDAAATDVCCSAMFAFGGKNASGQPTEHAIRIQRQRAEFATDYAFTWTALGTDPAGDAPPLARYGAAVATFGNSDLVLIGGTDSLRVFQEAWRGRLGDTTIFWHKLIP